MNDFLSKITEFAQKEAERTFPRVILCGKSGSGKTTMACKTWPAPRLLFDLECKANTQYNIMEEVAKGDLLIVPIRESISIDSMMKDLTISNVKIRGSAVPAKTLASEPIGYRRLLDQLRGLFLDLVNKPSHPLLGGTVIIDSLTSLSWMIDLQRLWTNDRAYMTLEEWGAVRESWMSFISSLKELSRFMHVVVTVHKQLIGDTQEEKNKDLHAKDENFDWEFTIAGSAKHFISRDFNEVYQLENKEQGGNQEYYLRTIQNGDIAKTSMNLKRTEPANFRHICSKIGLSRYFENRPEGFWRKGESNENL